MNRRWIPLLLAVFLGLVIPMTLFGTVSGKADEGLNGIHATVSVPEIESTTQQVSKDTIMISVLLQNGSAENMPINDYVLRVVLAEMPASFEAEALKAQSVVARTYTLRRYEGATKHESAMVCTDASCCQGYRTEEDYLNGSGTAADLNKIKQAVESTGDLVLVYDGALIEATYFSCSGGMTEDAADVWGEDIPYLRSTESPGEEKSAHYTDVVYFTTTEFEGLIGTDIPGPANSWIGKITLTAGNGVNTIEIGKETYSGTQIRSLLGLRSTAFTITIVGDAIAVSTKGFGHRVGMSQYGADAMAVQGEGFQDILLHYYNGTELVGYVDETD